MNKPSVEILPEDATGTWWFDTRHAAIIFDFDEDDPCWIRIPRADSRGWVQWSAYDLGWQRLAGRPYAFLPSHLAHVWRPEVGRPMTIGTSLTDRWTTSDVQSIRSLDDAEAPMPTLPLHLVKAESQHHITLGWDCPVDAEGETFAETLDNFLIDLDHWLDEQTKRRSGPSRTARWWAARVDSAGALRPFVEGHLAAVDRRRARLRALGRTIGDNPAFGRWEPSEVRAFIRGNLTDEDFLDRLQERGSRLVGTDMDRLASLGVRMRPADGYRALRGPWPWLDLMLDEDRDNLLRGVAQALAEPDWEDRVRAIEVNARDAAFRDARLREEGA